MEKLHVLLFSAIIILFIVIFFITQNTPISKDALPSIPSLPPQAATFQPVNPQVQGAQTSAQAQSQTNAQVPPQADNQQSAPRDMQGPIDATVSAVIKTSKGDIHVSLYGQQEPNTVRNFLAKATSGFYVNLIFHRVEDWVIQGGDPNGDGTGGGQMPSEASTQPFVTGSIGVARGSDASINNASQFFITKTDADWLNGQYTNFGIVTSGMDVVDKIQIGDKILGITIE